jgi:hypothetical protein
METPVTRSTTGRALAARHRLEAAHSLYRRDGAWYHVLRRFPGLLFDESGYLRFSDMVDYTAFVSDSLNLGVRENRETNTLHVAAGISKHPEYKRL